jgi:phosphate transport system ATP-binding protein
MQDSSGRESGLALHIRGLSVLFGEQIALRDCALDVEDRSVTAVIGPTGAGKTTLLRAINRMAELVPDTRIDGCVCLFGEDIYRPDIDPLQVRRRIAMVFSAPNPFPKSIYANIAIAPRLHGITSSAAETDALVETVLQRVGLWSVVKSRLTDDARSLSLLDQQRLCIARAIALNPNVILMNDPTAELDPISAAAIEEIVSTLKSRYCLMLVTHSMAQAARVSDSTVFVEAGRVVEQSPTDVIFTKPRQTRTEEYLTGRIG